MLWMEVHHEPGIRKACIEAGYGFQASVTHARQSFLNVRLIDFIDFLRLDLSVDVGGIGFDTALLRSNFYASSQSVNRGKSIYEVVVMSAKCPNKDWKLSRQISFKWAVQVEPEEYLPIYLKEGSEFRHNRRSPWPDRQHEVIHIVLVGRRSDTDSICCRRELQQFLMRVNFSTESLRHSELGLDAEFRSEKTHCRFIVSAFITYSIELRKPRAYLIGIQHRVCNSEFDSRFDCLVQELGSAR